MPNVRLQTLILLGIGPLLTVLSVIIALSHYFDIRRLIMRGFDNKLFAVSTVTASFIEPDIHAEIFEPVAVHSVVFDTTRTMIYGMDQSGMLYQIPPETGEAIALHQTTAFSVTDLAFNPDENVLYAANGRGQQLTIIDPADGNVLDTIWIGQPIFGLTYDASSGQLYGSHEALLSIDLETRQTVAIAPLDETIHALSMDDTGLYGLTSDVGTLIQLDPQTGAIDPLPFTNDVSAIAQQPLLGMTTAPNNGLYLSGSNQLFQVNASTQEILSEGFASSYRSERNDAYQGYIVPMRQIDEQLNLTYVYTQVVSGEQRITYVLDATEGADHTPIGYTEDLTNEEFSGVNYVATTGNVFLSDIQPWEEWGLLKVAYAPIFDEDGDVVAMAGADVNISIITQKTRFALLRVMGVGVGSLLIGIAASVYISRRLTRPIETLKETALRIAAGQYGQQIHINHPKELAMLSASFNKMSHNLKQNLTALEATNETLETVRRQQELIELLEQTKTQSEQSSSLVIQLYTPELMQESSGWVTEDDRVLLWQMGLAGAIAPPVAEPLSALLTHNSESPIVVEQRQAQRTRLENIRRHRELELIAARLLKQYSRWDDLQAILQSLFPTMVESFVFYDASSSTVKAIARQDSPYVLLTPDHNRQFGNLLDTPEIHLKPDQALVLISLASRTIDDYKTLPELTALLETVEKVLVKALQARSISGISPIFLVALTP
jgi:HAMP domain-containing protein